MLAQIEAEHAASLPKLSDLSTLARLLEYGSVLCYQNDDDWYAVHPMIRDSIAAQVDRIRARSAVATTAEPIPADGATTA